MRLLCGAELFTCKSSGNILALNRDSEQQKVMHQTNDTHKYEDCISCMPARNFCAFFSAKFLPFCCSYSHEDAHRFRLLRRLLLLLPVGCSISRQQSCSTASTNQERILFSFISDFSAESAALCDSSQQK